MRQVILNRVNTLFWRRSMSGVNLRDIRPRYNEKQTGLSDEEIRNWICPFDLFSVWLKMASDNMDEPNAMTLATATSSGIPSARMVLLKDFSKDVGFTFYTNYDGRKAQELKENPNAALVFYWPQLHRQVRVEGTVEKVDAKISEEYFRSRPKASQAGSAVSPQSRIVESRESLWDKNDKLLEGGTIEMPNWGGYAVKPIWIEFWQGQSNRLHDRIVFSQKGFDLEGSDDFIEELPSGWSRARLAP